MEYECVFILGTVSMDANSKDSLEPRVYTDFMGN
jgi:hypothetical protein